MRLTRYKLAFLSYALFDLLIGGHCGGLLPLSNVAAAQMTPVQGNITAASSSCLSTNCVTLQLDGATGAASIQLTGTFTATVSFEVSNDNGTTYVAINGTPPNSTTAVTSATATGLWQFNVAGFTHIRARGSAYTSGTAAVVINSARASAKSGGGSPYSSGGTTVNVIPKGDGSSKLADSSITDNGTTVATTELIVPPATSSATVVGGIGSASNGSGLNFQSSQLQFMASAQRLGTLNGTSFILASPITFAWSNSAADALGSSTDTFIGKVAAASIRLGNVNSATPIAQGFTVGESSRGGTDSNVAGASGSIKPGDGTGTGAGAKLCLQRNLMGATGSVAQTQIDGYCVGPSKTLSNTTATAQSLVNISVPSNSAGGVEGTITITCTDGTNFDAETQSFNTSFVNKATVLTVTAPVITATTAANNSGSCTAGITAVAGTNSVDIKVTPVFTTIVPTTVTSYIALRNNGTGNATFN